MADTRTLEVQTDQESLVALVKNHYNLQVAKGVVKDGAVAFNIIWQTSVLAPIVHFVWKPVYAFNWSITQYPSSGIAITMMGTWNICNPGEIIDLDENGMWTTSQGTPEPGKMVLGKNKFPSGTPTNGIHMMIGVQNGNGMFDVIFYDEDETGMNMSASYTPTEKMQWWFEHGVRTATATSMNRGAVASGDWSLPSPESGGYTKTSSYDFKTGTWTTKP